MSTKQNHLSDLVASVQDRFVEAKTILSFNEYLDSLYKDAAHFCRNSTQYIRDAIQHFGTREVESPLGQQTRYRIFDRSVEDQSSTSNQKTWVAGQEETQNALFRTLDNFEKEGRGTRLLLFHGPNGSGKTSIISSLFEALELYSSTQDGALYRFNWIFPSTKYKGGDIGFGSKSSKSDDPSADSFAHLQGNHVDARIICPMRDHPLLLLPKTERRQFFDKLYEEGVLPEDFQMSFYLRDGELSHRNRMLFDALMAHHGGDFSEVLRHIQVERYYISRRYRSGAVTIEPQMHVDASLKQVTADRSVTALPKYLSNLNLFEPFGALVDSNRGILEYSDMFKRPLETFKYLLNTCETGRATVEPMLLFLDVTLVGSANELNLLQARKNPDFISFKSRLELLRVPYILQYSVEQEIYDQQLKQSSITKPISPHLTRMAALWAVLTRLKPVSEPKEVPEEVIDMAKTFSPLEKAKLYDSGDIPSRFSSEQTKKLQKYTPEFFKEHSNQSHYEGRVGISPREMRILLLNAANNTNYRCVSPMSLFEELERFGEERSVYEFLELEVKNNYYDTEHFLECLKEEYKNSFDKEFRSATGLVQADQYDQLWTKYVKHVKASLYKEKLFNPITNQDEDPDHAWMQSIEEVLLTEKDSTKKFRQDIISKIAAYSLENPSQEIDIPRLFNDYINKLEQSFFSKQQKQLEKIAKNCLIYLVEDEALLSEEELEEARDTINRLIEEYGHPKEGLQKPIALILQKVYRYEEKAEEKSKEKEESSTS